MLRGPVYAYLIAEHLNRVLSFKICPFNCDCALSMRVIESTPRLPEEMVSKPLYPRMPEEMELKSL